MSWNSMDENNTRQEIVKCVVVGDTAVGKTRLICARACNAYLTLPQMLATHIPTVWAIDQYRIHKEVLQKSWMVVDGVNVSLRLWDTFGDHDKDRKFAYGRSDVVLLCFSVSNIQSLKNCKTKWYPEIRYYCPQAPILLVGCKNDLRHIYRDESFLELCREKCPFARIIQESDMVTRDQGRQLAEEIGAVYYEASVFTQYGVEEVFVNAMRLALIARRQQRFWVKSLKNVGLPTLQVPFRPPEPKEPVISIPESTFENDILSLLDKEYESDVKLIVRQTELRAHKVVLAAASSYFHQIFISLFETEHQDAKKCVTLTSFQKYSPSSVRCFLRFLYSGSLDSKLCNDCTLVEVSELAETTNITELQQAVINFSENDNECLKEDIKKRYTKKLLTHLKKICLQAQVFADVIFKVDNGKCYAHRSILMARCAVMRAMFGGDFRESSAEIIPFPGVLKETFDQFLYYLYMDAVHDKVNIHNCLPLIELANRHCLPHFISLIEIHVIQELSEVKSEGFSLSEHVLQMLEACQVHNADQLSEWCQHYIITNYQDISLNCTKLLRSLHPDNQAYLNKNRWPPTSYLKEYEFYERCVREREQREKPQKFQLWKTAKKKVNGYLCPTNKSKTSSNGSGQSIHIIHSMSN